MYCNECGHENRNGSKFCSSCGSKLESESPKLIKLKCNDCGGVMETDPDQTIATCKFCGSTSIFAVSEKVRLKKMDVELGEIGVEQTNADTVKIKEERKSDLQDYLVGILFLIISFCFACIVFGILIK